VVQETAGISAADKTFQLEYNRNGGGWNDVNGASSVVRAWASPNVADAANTTQQVGSGTFVTPNAGFDEVNGQAGGISLDFSGSDEVEVEYSVQSQRRRQRDHRHLDIECKFELVPGDGYKFQDPLRGPGNR
jgi:hypothetical protein